MHYVNLRIENSPLKLIDDQIWIWTRLRAPVIFMTIDSILFLFAIIRMGLYIRKNGGVKINIWYMLLHYLIFGITIASLYFAYNSKKNN
jgi:hypothetical protein